MPEIKAFLLLDVSTVVVCVLLLLRYAQLRHSHPAVVYLTYHLMVVTSRLAGLAAGAPPLFSIDLTRYSPMRPAEIMRAASASDFALVVMTLTWIAVARAERRRARHRSQPMLLRPRIVRLAAGVTFSVGLIGVFALAKLPWSETAPMDLGEWGTSSWIKITQEWPVLGLIALVYVKGFSPALVPPIAGYLVVMAYQGFHRNRIVIPLLLLTQIYLDRRGRKWPTGRAMVTLAAIVLLFVPLKSIGKLAQEGRSLGEISSQVREQLEAALRGRAPDQMVLDQFAAGVTLTDDVGARFMGRTYLGLLTLPIPRPLWQGKPGLADHLRVISTPERPMADMGAVLTFLGEAYINFGVVGLLLNPILIAYGLGRFYHAAYRTPYMSVLRFTYLLTAANLIVIFRDGLVSLVGFAMVTMMPLFAIAVWHAVAARPRRVARRRRVVSRPVPVMGTPRRRRPAVVA